MRNFEKELDELMAESQNLNEQLLTTKPSMENLIISGEILEKITINQNKRKKLMEEWEISES